MDMRPGQGPLMPTLAPPPGLGLPPGPLGLPPPPGLGHPGYPGPDLSRAPQSVPSSPSPGRPAPGVLGPSPSPSSSMSTFAAALRDLAKNAGEEPLPRKVNTPGPGSVASGPVTSSLLDVRKGFGRTTPAGETRSTPTPFPPPPVATELTRPVSRSSAPPTSLPLTPPTSTFSGFQPYPGRSPHPLPPPSPFPGAPGPGYHPAMMPGLPGLPYGPEADPLFQAQMARYAAAAAAASGLGLPPGHVPHLPPGAGHHLYPGHGPPGVIPPSLLASYPPELLQAYGLMGHFPPTSTAAVEMARLHEKLRSDEARRLEIEARKEAERREMIKTRERERSSPASGGQAGPAVKKSSSDALLKLSKIASHQPDNPMQRLQPSVSQSSCKSEIQSNLAGHKVPTIGADRTTAQSHSDASKSVKSSIPPSSDIKLPTAPLDFSELSVRTPGSESGPMPPCSPCDSVRSASPTPSSPSPPPDPNYVTASRCVPYVPKSRQQSQANKISDDRRASTPKKLFVRPFEDDYSPIQPPSGLGSAEEPLDISGSSLSSNKEGKQNTGTNVDLDDIVKPDDQDSDYESMSSDSSIKKEGSVLCPSSGLLTDDEAVVSQTGQFREPEQSSEQSAVSRKDKLNYLRYFRLVTHRKKNDIEIEKLEKRRERLRERSPSPVPDPASDERPSSPSLPLPSVSPHLNRLPESHAKAMYLSAIGLCRNSEEQKLSNEIMWSVILDDRLTRETPDKQSVITKYFVKLRDLPNRPEQAAHTEARGVKRSCDGSFLGPGAPASAPVSPVSPSGLAPARYKGLNIPSSDAVSRLTGDSSPVTLPSSVEINLCSLQPIAKPTLLLQEVKTEPGAAPAPPAHLQPHMTFPRVLSSPFTEVKSEPEDLTVTKKKRTGPSPYSWPGVEAILESYKKFTADCDLEKAALSERGARAQAEVGARRGQVDTISTRLSSLARLHKTLVSNHGHTASSLDTLRQQLVAISKLVNSK